MAYVIEIPVEAGGRLLVQASAEDLPGSLELASLRPGDVVARARESAEAAIDQIKPAAGTLANPEASEAAKLNALAIMDRTGQGAAKAEPERPNLVGVDLRGQDLNGRDLRGANLRGMRLRNTDLSGADLTNADLTGARLVRSLLTGAVLTGSRWSRAALLGTELSADLLSSVELTAAAIPRRDPADAMIQPSGEADCVACSPDGTQTRDRRAKYRPTRRCGRRQGHPHSGWPR